MPIDFTRFGFSKAFLGIESEGPFIGLPYVQLSLRGCATPWRPTLNYYTKIESSVVNPSCVHCLDPEQYHEYADRTSQTPPVVSDDSVLPQLRDFVAIVKDLSPQYLPNHLTIDLGCADPLRSVTSKDYILEQGVENCLRLAQTLAQYPELFCRPYILDTDSNQVTDSRVTFPIIVELRNYRHLMAHVSRSWRAHIRIDVSRTTDTAAILRELFPTRRGPWLRDTDQLKFVVCDYPSARKLTTQLTAFAKRMSLGNGMSWLARERLPWITLIVSPKMDKESVEKLMSWCERGGSAGIFRFIVPQHFFLNRWDR